MFTAVLLLVTLFSSAHAAPNVALAWDANTETNIAGYRLKYGTAAGTYSQTLDVGNVTTISVPNLTPGATYFFVVTAYNSSALESAPSTEISYAVPANNPPTVALTSPAPGASATAPVNFSVTASASDSDGSIARVEFYNGATKLGEDTTSPYSYSWPNVAAGTYSLVARAVDNLGASTDSAPVSVVVTAPQTPTAPGIASLAYLPGGTYQITVTGEVGSTGNLYVSPNMTNWILVNSFVNTTGTQVLTVADTGNFPQIFYRVSTQSGMSDPVGFVKTQVIGSSVNQSGALTYLGFGLLNPVTHRGTIESYDVQFIRDSTAQWMGNTSASTNGGYFIEITSGPHAGIMTDITSIDANGHTFTTDDDLSSFLRGGETYIVRRHRTIADTFGASNDAGLMGATTVSNADEVRIFNPTTQQFITYFYKTGGFGGSGWRATTDALTDASNTKLYLDQGVVIKRKAATNLTLVTKGAVKTGATTIPIGPKLNLVANVYPAGLLTLGNSGLRGQDDLSGVAGGSSVSSADEVRIYDGTSFHTYFYKTGGFGGIGWRQTSDALADAAATTIPAGASIFVIRKNDRPPFAWTDLEPF